MRKFILLLLVLSSVCQATDNYYVSTTGSDTPPGDGSQAHPWRTISKALTVASNDYIINLAAGIYSSGTKTLNNSKNGKTIVFLGATSDANDTIISSTETYAFTVTSCTSGVFTWKNVTIKSTYEGNRIIVKVQDNYDGVQLTFNNCVLGVPNDTTTGSTTCVYSGAITPSPTTRKITLTDSYCYGKDDVDTVYLNDIGTLTVSNTLIDGTNVSTSTTSAIRVGGDVGTVTINNGSVVKSKSYGLTSSINTSSFAKCEIDNVTFVCDNTAVTISDYLQNGIFTNITGNNGIFLGHIYEDCTHPLGQIVVQDNTLIHTGAVTAGVFGLVIGYGVTGAEVSNNNVLDFGIALSLKGTVCHIHHNIFRGGSNSAGDYYTVYVKSAKNCLFENNTVYALGKYALYLYDQVGFPADPDTDYNTFVNNTFDASGGGTYAIYLRGPEIYHNLFDYNRYVAGSKALGYASGANKTLAELRTWWAANAGTEEGKTNESHSIEAFSKSGRGTGTPSDPYRIATAEDLRAMAADTSNYDKCFILTADIDMEGQVFTTAIIAADTHSNAGFQGTAFTGTFDGNSHKITNFSINSGSNWYLGLFGYISSGGAVKNLGLENFVVRGHCRIGGLVGYNNISISNCYSTGSVSGSSYVGGLVGGNGGGSISNCYSTGAVSGSSGFYCVGGLVGGNGGGSISNCYSTGAVSGSSGSYYVGGLVGYNYTGSISGCYFLITSGPNNGKGQPLTDARMKQRNSFLGWDFTNETANGTNDYWRMCVDGLYYPHFRWEYSSYGDFVCPDGIDFYDFAVFANQWLLEKLSADVAPGTGDGIVNFIDYAVFADGWQRINGMNDLADFASQWLKPSACCADIAAAPGGDGVVNMLDLAIFTQHWLE